MKRYLRKLIVQARIIYKISIYQYFLYVITPKSKSRTLTLKGHRILVRKGTPDLEVAVSCLFGEFQTLRYLLPPNFSGVIVDAGGYIGTAAIALRDIYPNAKLIVIEPSPDNLTILKSNLDTFDNVVVIEAALVGRHTPNVKLNNRDTGEWGFTIVPNPADNSNPTLIGTVDTVQLSDIAEQHGEIRLLKLDIEGGEFDLFKHDFLSLSNIDIVFAELHDAIVDGCTTSFLEVFRDRVIVKDKGEKYLAVRR